MTASPGMRTVRPAWAVAVATTTLASTWTALPLAHRADGAPWIAILCSGVAGLVAMRTAAWPGVGARCAALHAATTAVAVAWAGLLPGPSAVAVVTIAPLATGAVLAARTASGRRRGDRDAL